MTMKSRRIEFVTAVALGAILLSIGSEAADVKYQKPPQAVLDVFNAPPFPSALPNPAGDTLLLGTPREGRFAPGTEAHKRACAVMLKELAGPPALAPTR